MMRSILSDIFQSKGGFGVTLVSSVLFFQKNSDNKIGSRNATYISKLQANSRVLVTLSFSVILKETNISIESF